MIGHPVHLVNFFKNHCSSTPAHFLIPKAALVLVISPLPQPDDGQPPRVAVAGSHHGLAALSLS